MDARSHPDTRLRSRHATPRRERVARRAHLLGVAEVFKRTFCISDLKPAGRFVAKDLVEGESVALPTKPLLDNGFMHGSRVTVTRCTVAENLTRIASNCAPVAVAKRRYQATGMAGIRLGRRVELRNGDFERRRAAWQPRGSSCGSGYVWKYAQQVGLARHGAVTHPGGAAEKACYADI